MEEKMVPMDELEGHVCQELDKDGETQRWISDSMREN